MTTLVVPHRYNGPPHSGNGGWTCGALAELLSPGEGEAVQVRLSAPPPLDVPLAVTHAGAPEAAVALAASSGAGEPSRPVASASVVPSPFADPPPAPVAWEVALDAEPRYRGLADHPFPTCFSCGTARADGLGLRPGPLLDRPDETACTWSPTEAVTAAVTWSALDCPGGWSVDLAGRPMVLGTMTARLDVLPRVGQRHLVVGRVLRQEGRKAWTETALYAVEPAPRLLAQAAAVWIAVEPSAVRPV